MLLSDDVNLIKSTRSEIVSNRQTTLTLYKRTITGNDPYTGEPIYSYTTTVVNAVISGFYSEVGGERLLVNGIAIEKGDVKAVVDISVDLTGVTKVIHDSAEYTVISVAPRGLGEDNRYDVILRRVAQQ